MKLRIEIDMDKFDNRGGLAMTDAGKILHRLGQQWEFNLNLPEPDVPDPIVVGGVVLGSVLLADEVTQQITDAEFDRRMGNLANATAEVVGHFLRRCVGQETSVEDVTSKLRAADREMVSLIDGL